MASVELGSVAWSRALEDGDEMDDAAVAESPAPDSALRRGTLRSATAEALAAADRLDAFAARTASAVPLDAHDAGAELMPQRAAHTPSGPWVAEAQRVAGGARQRPSPHTLDAEVTSFTASGSPRGTTPAAVAARNARRAELRRKAGSQLRRTQAGAARQPRTQVLVEGADAPITTQLARIYGTQKRQQRNMDLAIAHMRCLRSAYVGAHPTVKFVGIYPVTPIDAISSRSARIAKFYARRERRTWSPLLRYAVRSKTAYDATRSGVGRFSRRVSGGEGVATAPRVNKPRVRAPRTCGPRGSVPRADAPPIVAVAAAPHVGTAALEPPCDALRSSLAYGFLDGASYAAAAARAGAATFGAVVWGAVAPRAGAAAPKSAFMLPLATHVHSSGCAPAAEPAPSPAASVQEADDTDSGSGWAMSPYTPVPQVMAMHLSSAAATGVCDM